MDDLPLGHGVTYPYRLEVAKRMKDEDKEVRNLHQQNPRGTWVQTERSAHEALAILIAEAPRAAQLLHVLIANMDKSNALIASHATLAKLSGVSTTTTKRALKVLSSQAWIQTIQLGGDRGGALAYIVNSRIAWADKRENIQYARFNARVLVSSADQSDLGTGELRGIPSADPGDIQLPHGDGLPPPKQELHDELLPQLPAIPHSDEA